jgi:hypothetical protein
MASRHPNKHIQAAIEFAIENGWRLEIGGAHAWGTIYCPHGRRGGCKQEIWSTPQKPENFAKFIRKIVSRCPHA